MVYLKACKIPKERKKHKSINSIQNIDETRNYFLEEIEQNVLMSRKHKKVCATPNYIEHFLISASTITGCISISAFASFLGIPVGITSSAIGLKNCAILQELKKISQ